MLLVVGMLSALALSVAAPGPTALDEALVSLLARVPGLDAWLWQIAYLMLVIWPAVIALLSLVRRGRRRLMGDYLLAAGLAFGLAMLAGAAAGTAPSETLRALLSPDPPPVYVATRLALATAILVAASPHIARPLRYTGRLVILFGSVAAVALGAALPIGSLAALAIGFVAVATTHLILGSPAGRPTPAEVDLALADLGIDASDVTETQVELSGVAMFTASDSDGGRLLIKVYGRDAWDGQLLTSTWSALQNRGETPHLFSGRLGRVEHEAVATLIAERAGVPVLPALADLADASLAPDRRTLMTDRAQLLVTQGMVVGNERAVAAAMSVMGADGIAVLAYFVITRIAGVDLQAVWAELAAADMALLLAALLLSPTIQFIALVLPATAARLALEIRFFEKYGIAAGAAISIGVVDSVSGFAVQIMLLLFIGLSALPGLTSSIVGSSASDTSTAESSTPSLMMLAFGLAVLGAIITLVIPRLRHRVQDSIPKWRALLREQATAAQTSLTVLRHPGKVAQMLMGNLGAQVIQAIILGICLNAFGQDAYLSQLILINTAVSLFAGLMPEPGGMGVAEAGYTAGLQAIGVPSSIAISTAIAFRLVTFYLPPLWGSVSMRWLRRHEYV